MRYIWIVRHGERVDNVDPEWKHTAPRGAWDDPPLTSRGLQQAREVGAKLAKEQADLDFVFSSPFLRCLQTTSNILAEIERETEKENEQPDEQKRKPKKINLEPGFCESLNVCQSPPGFLGNEELKSLFPRIDLDYKPVLSKSDLKLESTSLDCLERIQSTLEQILLNFSGNILIVSHGSPIAACHDVLTQEYKYVGQCTISKYHILPSKRDQHALEPWDPKEKEPLTVVKKLEAHPSKAKKTRKLLKNHEVKCLLAGDSSHLSDRRNLRDVLRT